MIVGIDQSSKKLGVTILELPNPDDPFGTHDPVIEFMGSFSAGKKATIDDRIVQMCGFLDNLIRSRDIELLMCESPLVGRGGAKATILQSMVVGAVYLTAKKRGCVSVGAVHPSTWKSQVVGNGKAAKEDVAAWVQASRSHAHNLANGDQDIIDSYCIAEYGAGVYARGTVITGST